MARISLAAVALALVAVLPLASSSPLHGRSFVVKEELDAIPRGWQRFASPPRDYVLDLRIGTPWFLTAPILYFSHKHQK
jgi:hypothetical protein